MHTTNSANLKDLGWNRSLEEAWVSCRAGYRDLLPGRIISVAGEYFFAAAVRAELLCTLSGKVEHSGAEPPVTGDWAAIRPHEGREAGVIEALLPRKSVVRRLSPGRRTAVQPLAANVDTVFIVSGGDEEFNPRRIERYLTIAWDSGATPVILLNKCDLLEDPAGHLRVLEETAPAVEVHPLSAVTGAGMEQVSRYLYRGTTGVLIGSSGTGKSTLINRLLGTDRRATRETREGDGKGRHMSVDRRLEVLPNGGCLIDTPGLREVGLWSADGIEESFADILDLAAECRFNDCSHDHEPGCAVKRAVERGELSPERLASYRKQLRELAFTEDRKSAQQRKEAWNRGIAQEVRRWKKNNEKR